MRLSTLSSIFFEFWIFILWNVTAVTGQNLTFNTNTSIVGRYEMVSSENFGEYLKAFGVGMTQRNLAERVTPTEELTEAGGKYTLKTITSLKKTEITFTLGEDFDETTADGRQSKSTITKEGNKLIHIQRIAEAESVITREFFDNEMRAYFETKGVVARRVYNRV